MKDNCVLITGGAGGIGSGISKRLSEDGYKIIILDIVDPENEFTGDFFKVDLSDTKTAKRILKEIDNRYSVTRLVNNVGIVKPALLEDTNPEDFLNVMKLNTLTALMCTQAVLPAMRKAHFGRIVSITSRAVLGKELRTAYSASKGALTAMTRTWALELAGDGITVNAVAPGPIETEAFRENNPAGDPRTGSILNNVPVKRLGSAADVAHAVSYFLDERSGFVTGQTLYVCGGITIGNAG